MGFISNLFKKNVVQDNSRNTEEWYLQIKKKEEENKISDEVLEYAVSVSKELKRRFNLFCYEQYQTINLLEYGCDTEFDESLRYAEILHNEFNYFNESFTCCDWRFERIYSKYTNIYYKNINMSIGSILDTGEYCIIAGLSVTFEMIGSE